MKRSNKSLPEVEVISYGRFTRWQDNTRELPELQELTHEIEGVIDVEFGMIVEIYHGKGRWLEYVIHHPPFRDKNGDVAPSFEGRYQIKSNPFRFFLGDTIWEPVEDKKGDWEFLLKIDETIVARKKLKVK